MGLIRSDNDSFLSAVKRDMFYCNVLGTNSFALRGRKRDLSNSPKSLSTIDTLTNGARIIVEAEQCVMIVCDGKVLDLCAEPGEYIYDSVAKPSIFVGDLDGESIRSYFETVNAGNNNLDISDNDLEVIYFNTKEFKFNKFGSLDAVPYLERDESIGLAIDISVMCTGDFSFRISNPALFYSEYGEKVIDFALPSKVSMQLKKDFNTALPPALAKASEKGISYMTLPIESRVVLESMNSYLGEKWKNTQGIEITGINILKANVSMDDQKRISEMRRNASDRDQKAYAERLLKEQMEAMQQAKGMSSESFFWTCKCGAENTGNFCPHCGEKKPEKKCGCSKCGWKPADPDAEVKFCPECGNML